MSRFLFTRGLWLIFLEVTLFRCLGLQFNFDYHLTMLNVLWALGWAMIVLSALVHLPAPVVTAFGVVMIAGHNLLDRDSVLQSGLVHPALSQFHRDESAALRLRRVPADSLDWSYCCGIRPRTNLSPGHPNAADVSCCVPGLGVTAAFVILRAINIYGDPVRWTTQKSAAFTVLSFLNTNKYPPSLLFLLMTLGPALLFLWAVDGGTPRFLRPALVLGKVPMFYYLLHMPLIHLIAVVVCYARYGTAHWMFESPTIAQFPITPPPGWGYLFADYLFDLGLCGDRALSAVPLVCSPETAPQRCLAQLFLIVIRLLRVGISQSLPSCARPGQVGDLYLHGSWQ